MCFVYQMAFENYGSTQNNTHIIVEQNQNRLSASPLLIYDLKLSSRQAAALNKILCCNELLQSRNYWDSIANK